MPTILSEPFVKNNEQMRNCDKVRTESDFHQPNFRVILFQPEIPQNTGNIARTCAATRIPLHLVEPLGFQLSDRHLKRAGLDYWPYVDLTVHPSLESLREEFPRSRWVYFSSHAQRSYFDFSFQTGDCLVFGSETRGLPAQMLASEHEQVLQIPVDRTRVRSLNLSSAVGIVLFEALRQSALQDKRSIWYHTE